MICLDTNYLVRVLIPGTLEAAQVEGWLGGEKKLFAASIAWYEFRCGPVTPAEVELVRSILTGGILPFDEAQAAEAARLYNAAKRIRRLRVDAMIAATAKIANTRLATGNPTDFEPFLSHGLLLV